MAEKRSGESKQEYGSTSSAAGPGAERIEYRSSEIPRGEWRSFLDSFSRQHEGWRVILEVKGGGVSGPEAENLRLDGVSSEHSEGHDRISIALGTAPDDHLTHFVDDPIRVVFLEATGGGDVGLKIEAADGSQTLIRFRGPAKPEQLDNVAA